MSRDKRRTREAQGCCCPSYNAGEPRVYTSNKSIAYRFVGFKDDNKLYRRSTMSVSGAGEIYPLLESGTSNASFGSFNRTNIAHDPSKYFTLENSYNPKDVDVFMTFSSQYEAHTDQVLVEDANGNFPFPVQATGAISHSQPSSSTLPNSVQPYITYKNLETNETDTLTLTANLAASIPIIENELSLSGGNNLIGQFIGTEVWSTNLTSSDSVSNDAYTISVNLSEKRYSNVSAEIYDVSYIFSEELTELLMKSEVAANNVDWTNSSSSSAVHLDVGSSQGSSIYRQNHPGWYDYYYKRVDVDFGRFRFKIPTGHEGTYFSIEWSLIDPDDNEVETGVIEWSGPGDLQDHENDNWFTPWVESPSSLRQGDKKTYRVVIKRYKHYHSQPWQKP